MTNADLAKMLNAEFNLIGADAVTVNVIRQWVSWDVLTKAIATGRGAGNSPDWNRDARSLRRARRLTELRIAGIRRENAFISQAFIEWGHQDFDRVRMAIGSEFHRARKRLFKPLTTSADMSDYGSLSVVEKKTLRNQSGPLDSRFLETQFEQSGELYASFLNLALSGNHNADRIKALFADATDQIAPEFRSNFAQFDIDTMIGALAGIFGDPDEIGNSAQKTIEQASIRQFRIARIVTVHHLKTLRITERISEFSELNKDVAQLLNMIASIVPQISIGDWLISGFVTALHGIKTNDQPQ